MNNLTKAIEEAMMDVSRWEYVHHDLIESPAYLNSAGLKDHATGIVFELKTTTTSKSILYLGVDLNISTFTIGGFMNKKYDYHKQIGLSDLYKAYNVEE